ncbi:alpha-glucosidase [Rubellimicrobium arenae]|uniref:alpha-glucosidase n=1 Tax=Rubellimicrobium arenae TaxID=2817372 RepID=UPI001B310395|nr:alpha-glucosidase [Rubellimicrobium arenae]
MPQHASTLTETPDVPSRRWWKEAVVYQVYPRSFADSDGDGIGDLPGLISRLDHITGLGVDVIWLSPHFDSPNADNGYDIRDYRKVMHEFGTMEDFDRLLAECSARGLRLIIDLVVNHTSDEHAWFAESRSSRGNPKRDYYIWRDGSDGVPNNWPSFFGGSAWTKDEPTGDYYLHLFAAKQPDLNWDNPEVRAEVYDLMRFWLDKGVAGFRMDVIPFISKDPSFPDLTAEQLRAPQDVYANGPRVHDYLQEMNREVLSRYDVMTVGEAFGVSDRQASLFVAEDRHELNMVFHFDVVRLDREGWRRTPWSLPDLKAVYTRLDHAVGGTGWNTVFLGNHDTPRAVSHFGDDSAPCRVPSAKALATMMLAQRGTPFIYQGEELGMTNYPFQSIDQFDDVEVKGLWADWVETGRVEGEELLSHLRHTSRDHARTPMQWTGGRHAGFTTGPNPWFAIHPNHSEVNAAAALVDEHSVYRHYQRLIALRRAEPALVYGDYLDLDPAHERLFVFSRSLGGDHLLVVVNFSRDPEPFALPAGPEAWRTLLSNDPGRDTGPLRGDVTLGPWEALILKA